MKIVVGLGNPGAQYQNTRHNAGFMVLDAFAKSRSLRFRTGDSRIHTAEGSPSAPAGYILAKPQTFMNRSGTAVRDLLDRTGGSSSDLLVVHDELDLGFGRLKIKFGGGHAGHRGVESVIAALQSPQFYRLRVGIGKPNVEDFVLSEFLPEEKSILNEMIDRALAALGCFIEEGPERAMNLINPSVEKPPDEGKSPREA